jgi:hypothetical protein
VPVPPSFGGRVDERENQVGKRWIAALTACVLLFGVTACGGDDDDDVADEATTEETDETVAPEQVEADETKAAFCADLNDPSEGDEPIEDLEASRDLAIRSQTVTETQEQFDATQLLVDFANHLIDNDDGDGVVTGEEVSAALEAFPTIEDGIAVASEWCAGSRDSNGDAG